MIYFRRTHNGPVYPP